MLMWCVEWFKTVCVRSFQNSITSCLHGFLHPFNMFMFSLLDNISKWKYYMLFGDMKGSGVSDVDLFYHVSCSFGWLSFPWEKERLGCFQSCFQSCCQASAMSMLTNGISRSAVLTCRGQRTGEIVRMRASYEQI